MRLRVINDDLVEIPIAEIADVGDIQIYGKESNNGERSEKLTDMEYFEQHDLTEMTSFGGDG